MKLNNTPETYICQLNKPENRKMLEHYAATKDKSSKTLVQYYKDLTNALIDTPAWGISGVNKMINELTIAVYATLYKEKEGKTSAYAHARRLLRTIDHFGKREAEAFYKGSYRLKPLITEAEFDELGLAA